MRETWIFKAIKLLTLAFLISLTIPSYSQTLKRLAKYMIESGLIKSINPANAIFTPSFLP
jgi:hypothetical protein